MKVLCCMCCLTGRFESKASSNMFKQHSWHDPLACAPAWWSLDVEGLSWQSKELMNQPDAFDSESIASADDFVYSYHKVEFASDGTAKLWFVEVHRTGWQEWRLDCNNLCIDTDYHAAWPSNFHPVWECCRRCQFTFHTMYYFTHGIHQGLMLKTPSWSARA